MPLQPGPFLQGSTADVTVPPGNYDFTDDAVALANQLTGIAAGWESFMDGMNFLSDLPLDFTYGIDTFAVTTALNTQQTQAFFPELDTLVNDMGPGLTLLTAAISFAPAAAWTTPTASFVPPDPTQTIVVPTVPLGLYDPTITTPVGGTGTATTPSVTLQNLTRVGSQNFTVGDRFLLTVRGNPGQTVTIDAVKDGQALGSSTLGTIPAIGEFAITSVEGPDDVGAWLENLYVDGVNIATWAFIVSPSS